MGGFYGGIHFFGADWAQVRKVLEAVAEKRGVKFFVSPEKNGCFSVLPSNRGQDFEVSAELARLLPFDALHLLVHDDDLLAYRFYRDHEVVDEFDSAPEYFGPKSDSVVASLRGHPERWTAVLGEPRGARVQARVARLRSRCDLPEDLFELADAMEMPNVATSFEDIESGEAEGIEDPDAFIEVPDRSAERARQEAEEAASKLRLFASGALLAEHAEDRGRSLGVFGADASGGLFVSWWSLTRAGDVPLLRFAPPWSSPGTPTGIELPGMAISWALSRDGRHLALLWPPLKAESGRRLEVWSLELGTKVSAMSANRTARWLAFTRDGRALVVPGDGELVVAPLQGSGELVIPIEGEAHANRGAVMHPREDAVLLDFGTRWVVVDLSGATKPASIEKPQASLPPEVSAMVEESVAGLDPTQLAGAMRELKERGAPPCLPATWQREFDQLSSGLGPGVEATLDAFLAGVVGNEAAMETLKRATASVMSGLLGQGRRERLTPFAFSEDGTRLFASNGSEVLVLDWKAVRSDPGLDSGAFPTPLVRATALPDSPQARVMELLEDPHRDQLLVLVAGEVVALTPDAAPSSRVLLEPPQGWLYGSIALADHGRVLATLLVPHDPRTARSRGPKLQLWDLARLSSR